MLTRHAKAYSSSGSVVLAENWGVHAKLIYKYQILYLDHIMIVAWRHRVNDIDLCRSPKSPKIHKTPYFGVQGYSRSLSLPLSLESDGEDLVILACTVFD